MEIHKIMENVFWIVMEYVFWIAMISLCLSIFTFQTYTHIRNCPSEYSSGWSSEDGIEEGYVKCCKTVYNESHEANIKCDIMSVLDTRTHKYSHLKFRMKDYNKVN